MSNLVVLEGSGVISALGCGVKPNLQGLRKGLGLYHRVDLSGFNEVVSVPYLPVGIGQNSGAEERTHQLIDSVLEEVFSNTNISAEHKLSMPIFIGSSSYGIGLGEELYRNALISDISAIPLPLDGFTQVSKHLRRRHQMLGADYAFNTACTASANALLSAIKSIQQGHHPYALVLGIEAYNATTLYGFYGLQLLSGEQMRPFDKQRNGLVLGEGCAALLLKASVKSNQKLIFCGGASGCDTFSVSSSNPNGSSIAEVMHKALADSNVSTKDILAIKAHGTATLLNDEGEAAAMRQVFDSVPDFFSLKSYIGHTLGGCGAIETALMAACLESQLLPISAGFREADKHLAITPTTTPGIATSGHYMLNFFGFGGNNCSLIIKLPPHSKQSCLHA